MDYFNTCQNRNIAIVVTLITGNSFENDFDITSCCVVICTSPFYTTQPLVKMIYWKIIRQEVRCDNLMLQKHGPLNITKILHFNKSICFNKFE